MQSPKRLLLCRSLLKSDQSGIIVEVADPLVFAWFGLVISMSVVTCSPIVAGLLAVTVRFPILEDPPLVTDTLPPVKDEGSTKLVFAGGFSVSVPSAYVKFVEPQYWSLLLRVTA